MSVPAFAPTKTAIPGSIDAMMLIGRGVMIEVIRRKEFCVLLILMALYGIGVGISAVVGIENHQTLLFVLNLGLSFAYFSAHLLTLLTAARQIPFEVDNRTIYPLLAKPVSRQQYLLGKWAATTVAGLAVFFVLFVMSYIPWLLFPNTPALSPTLLLQAIFANAISLGLIAALALLGSLLLPQGVNMTVLGLFLFAGSTIINFIRARAELSGAGDLVRWLTAYLPDFNHLNLFNRYTDAVGPVAGSEFLGLVAYGVIFILASHSLSSHFFGRRPL
jgi:ABC-type transport system involved in multi-copper enzyme maturation permease subunit